jgi:hypothetical protein
MNSESTKEHTTSSSSSSSNVQSSSFFLDKLPTTQDSIQDSMKGRNTTVLVAKDSGVHPTWSETTRHVTTTTNTTTTTTTEETKPSHRQSSELMSQPLPVMEHGHQKKMMFMSKNHSNVISQFSQHEVKTYNNIVVSPIASLAETCEAYQEHFQTFLTIGKSRLGSEFFQTFTILEHLVSSWIEKGGCFVNQGEILNVDSNLLQCIMLNQWNPCMKQTCKEQEEIELQMMKSSTNNVLLSHSNTCCNYPSADDIATKNEKVVTLGSNTLSDEFLYHIYPYVRFHAKNIHSTITRYRNSKRCLKYWYKHGGKMTDLNGLDLTHPEALCVMERILWQHHDEWLKEYIVI